jgi:uncharacterized RDD family membrane protein YckC
MNTIKITTTQNIELDYELASVGERIAGYFIDVLVIIAYIIIVLFILIGGNIIDWNSPVIFLVFIPIFFYDLISEVYMNGQSAGKRVMRIKVISLNGNQASVGQYLIRWLFRLVDFTLTNNLCALISVAVSEKKQRVGDMVAGTTLIRTTPRTAFQQTIYVPTRQADYTVSFPEVANLTDKDMQLIKEVIISVNRTGNMTLANEASEKIKQTLHIQSSMPPLHFLQVLLSDYNHLTSGEEV